MRRAAILALCLFAAACGKGDNEPGPGGITVGEARALDEAAAMLDEQRVPQDALAPSLSQAPSQASPAP